MAFLFNIFLTKPTYAGVYGAVNASAYSRSLYNSAGQYQFPLPLTWGLISFFSLGLATAITNSYSKSNKKVLKNLPCLNKKNTEKKPTEKGASLQSESVGYVVLNDASGESTVEENHSLSAWIPVAEKTGAVGKAVISNLSMFRFFHREIGNNTHWMDVNLWAPSVFLIFTFPATIFSQYAVLKKDEKQASVIQNCLKKTCLFISSANIARLANIPGTFMYFDTARKLAKRVGWLTEAYQPWPVVGVLGLFSFALLIAGDYKFQKDIERVAQSEKVESIESKWIGIKRFHFGKMTNVASAFMKSFTGELSLLLALKELGEDHFSDNAAQGFFYSAIVVTALPIFVTMYSYFVAKQDVSKESDSLQPAV